MEAVLRYNCFARSVTTFATIPLGAPLVSYFGDFAAFLPANLAPSALATFERFCALLGITLKHGKSVAGHHVAFLGLRGSIPSLGNLFRLAISRTVGKSSKWATSIADCVEARTISHHQLAKLMAVLSFPQTHLFAKFPRTQLRPLYRELYRKGFNAKLALIELRNLRWWESIIRPMTPRWVDIGPKWVSWIAYTDAATLPQKICDVLFRL